MQLVIRNHRDTGEREMVARCDANWDLGDSSTPAASTTRNLFTVNKLQDSGKTKVIFVQHFVQ
jgi:hypothetical protein